MDNLIKNLNNSTELLFKPMPQQRQAKATFWTFVNDSMGGLSPEDITLAKALQITNDNRLNKWWKVPGFSEWFSNKDEFRQRLEYLANLALDKVEDIILADDPKLTSAQVNIIKCLMEVAGKVPARVKEVKYLDEAVSRMDKRQLEAFLKQLPEGSSDEPGDIGQ